MGHRITSQYVGWVKPTVFVEKEVGFTHPTENVDTIPHTHITPALA